MLETDDYAFKVFRIEPENNIHLILEDFSESKMNLVIICNWNFSKYGKDLRIKFSSYSNLKLLDPIYEQDKLNEIRSNCKLYIHGHSVGGTNPSLVEAMNLGLCCVVYNVDYNIETTENSAIYFNTAEELKVIVNKLENKTELTSYKNKMLEIAKRRYIWKLIIEKYSNLFS